MESLLYSIAGLPVHPLIVHFAVVILPLATTALIALIYMPKLKSQYSFITIIAIVLGSAAVLVAKQTGEALAERMGTPLEHADYASLLTGAAFIFMCLSLIWYRSAKGRRSRVVTPLGHTTVVAGIAVLALTFLTGHTGAQAVWQGKMASLDTTTSSASPTPKATTTSSAKSSSGIKWAEIKKHSTPSSCWSVVNGNVYDLTKWISRHPGGQSVIKNMCGRDGTSGFKGQHAGANRPASELARFKIGKLA